MYHYTTAEALKNILEREELWLSHYRYMNDNQELFYYFNEVKMEFMETSCEELMAKKSQNMDKEHKQKIISDYLKSDEAREKINDSIRRLGFYIGSFCVTSNDLLSQWRGYTSEHVGYCIEFDEEELAKTTINDHPFTIVDCNYDRESIVNKLSEAKSEYVKGDIGSLKMWLNRLIMVCVLSKHRGFEEENEKRIVLVKPENAVEKPLFRIKNGVFVPYIPLKFQKKAIKSITVGPTNQSDLCKESLVQFLANLDYKRVEVYNSDTPLTK